MWATFWQSMTEVTGARTRAARVELALLRSRPPMEIRAELPIDLALTLGALQRGSSDPTFAFHTSGVWLAMRTPQGPATMRLVTRGACIVARAWGPGEPWALASASDLVGARDDVAGFEPVGVLRDLHRRFAGLRFPRTERVFDALMPTILEQKVTTKEAHRSYASIVRRWGKPAPQPVGAPRLFVPPAPEVLAQVPYWQMHEMGVERRRADTVRAAASRARRVEEAARMNPTDARARLEALPGVGPWTAAQVAMAALGDSDAVPLGDYHLPHVVAHVFTGRARGDEEQMMALLAPYAGHRGRVVRLLLASGAHAPRFGPRRPLRRVADL